MREKRWYARPRIRRYANPRISFTFRQVAARMGFPTNATGKGITVGILSLGGALPVSRLASFLGFTPNINIVELPGADMRPDPQGADVENCLDANGICSIAPDVTINFYAGPNSAAGMLAIVERALSDGVFGLSQSWGAPENESSNIPAMEAAYQNGYEKGMLFTAASGDNAADDGEAAPVTDFPACSAWNLGCGGTSYASPVDRVWGDTGGGISKIIRAQPWQVPFFPKSSPWRGVPDVAALADPDTGYQSIDGDGNVQVIGGTSAVAPLYMGLWALLCELNGGKPVPNPLAWVYSLADSAFTDITVGSNGYYSAGTGYDYCTGRGEAVGRAWAASLGGTASPNPTPTPAGDVSLATAQGAVRTAIDALPGAQGPAGLVMARHAVSAADAALASLSGWPS